MRLPESGNPTGDNCELATGLSLLESSRQVRRLAPLAGLFRHVRLCLRSLVLRRRALRSTEPGEGHQGIFVSKHATRVRKREAGRAMCGRRTPSFSRLRTQGFLGVCHRHKQSSGHHFALMMMGTSQLGMTRVGGRRTKNAKRPFVSKGNVPM